MSKYKQTNPLHRLKLIVTITLLFVSYSSFSQINKKSSTINNTDTSTVRQAQDYNSSRGMKTSNRNRTKQSANGTTRNDSTPRPAQDYNSSRSNKPRPIALINDTIGNDSLPETNKAQDYNSSRSNKPSPILNKDDKFENDTIPRANQAQDYNSSRSNKPRPIVLKDDTIKNSIKRKKIK